MQKNLTERREAFRALLDGVRCVRPASVFDPISIRIAQDLGFEVAMFAGSVASMTVTGAPDLMGLTLTEFAQQIARLSRTSDLSLLVDADDGYGNAINVMRTVTELEIAGVAAMTLEDTVLPQPFGAGGATRLTSVEEGVARLHAALAARRDPATVIVGRTSAPEVNGLDDGIARAKAYANAGVDALFVIGIETRADLEALRAAVELPLILYVDSGPLADLDYLASQGVRVALQAHAPFAAAVQAVHDTMLALRDGAEPGGLPGIASQDLMNRVTRKADYQAAMKKFVR